MTINVELEAAEEFVTAADWYNGERAGLGDEFLESVLSTIKALPERLVHRPHPEHAALGVRLARVGGWPYLLVYVMAGDRFSVIALSHEKRQPGYWLRRLR